MLVFRIAPLTSEEYIQREIGRNWLNSFYTELKNEIDFLGSELYGESYPHFPEVKRYKDLIAEKNHIEAAKITKKSRGDYMLKTRNDWYPRYKICKDKMNVLKTSPVFGHKIYQLLLENFSQLTALEEKQKNRYFFLVKKEWWNNLTQ